MRDETLYLTTKGLRVHVFRPSDYDDKNGARNLVTKCTVVDCSSEGTELLQRAMICVDIANTSRLDFSACRVSRQKHELTLIASPTGAEHSKSATPAHAVRELELQYEIQWCPVEPKGNLPDERARHFDVGEDHGDEEDDQIELDSSVFDFDTPTWRDWCDVWERRNCNTTVKCVKLAKDVIH